MTDLAESIFTIMFMSLSRALSLTLLALSILRCKIRLGLWITC